jgi:hypothetical protein
MNYGKNSGIYYSLYKKSTKKQQLHENRGSRMKHGNLLKNVHGLKQNVSKTTTITENITVYVVTSEKQLEEIKNCILPEYVKK